MKRFVSLVLAVLFVITALPVSAEEPFIGMPNPATEYAGFAELREDHPDIEMAEPPAGAQDILYRVIECGGYAYAEILFTLEGVEYTYRCLPREEDDLGFYESFGSLHGLYYDFDISRVDTVMVNDTPYNMNVEYCTAEGIGHADWYDFESVCAYDISANAPEEAILSLAKDLIGRNGQHSELTGFVTECTEEALTLVMENGNVVNLPLLIEADVKPGDKVMVTYAGAVTENPTVIRIDTISRSDEFFGSVAAFTADTVTVRAESGSQLVFRLLPQTRISGVDTAIRNGAVVCVFYGGDVSEELLAYEITIEVAGIDTTPEPTPEPVDPKLIDKKLDGTVTKVSSKYFKLKTSKGKTYKFMLTDDTEFTGKYKFKVNCEATVTYDGYASKSPDAKIVKVTAAAPKPTPTPAPSKLKTAKGAVTAVCGIWITLDDGHVYTVNSANCKITGADKLCVGCDATLKYRKEGSERICEKATFDNRVYY